MTFDVELTIKERKPQYCLGFSVIRKTDSTFIWIPSQKTEQHDGAFWTGLHTSSLSSEPFPTCSQCALARRITHQAPRHDTYKWLPTAQGQRLKSLHDLQGLCALAPPFSSVLSFIPFPFQLRAPITLSFLGSLKGTSWTEPLFM